MASATPVDRSRFGFHFIALARRWRRAIDHALATAGLSDATWAPLIQLAEGGDDISQTELAARVGLDTSSLVRLLDLLEARGWIERRVDPADRRARRIVITRAGRAELKRIRARLDRIEAELLADLDDTRIEALLQDFAHIEARISAVLARGTR